MSATGYKRVYANHGTYYFVDRAGKWHRLTRVEQGEPAMMRALAKFLDAPAARPGSMPALIKEWREQVLPSYTAATQYDYGLMLAKLEVAFQDRSVEELDSHDILDLRDQWKGKGRARTANKYHALVSVLMAYAIERRMRKTNPCLEVKKLPLKKRRRYLTHDEFRRIVQGALIGKDGRKVASGKMMACLFGLAYLTALRMKDLRLLTWGQIGEKVITVTPTKTRHSTHATIEIEITPEIRQLLEEVRGLGAVKGLTVFHNLKGKPYSKDGIETAWQRACERAGVVDAHFHDLRAKALSDALRNGLSIKAIADSASHASVTTTEGYLHGFEVKRSALGLTLPPSQTGTS